MQAVRRWRRGASAPAAQATAAEQAEMQLPFPHSPGEMPADPSDFWGEALAGQRRGNNRRRPEILGRIAAISNLVEQSLGPLTSRAISVQPHSSTSSLATLLDRCLQNARDACLRVAVDLFATCGAQGSLECQSEIAWQLGMPLGCPRSAWDVVCTADDWECHPDNPVQLTA